MLREDASIVLGNSVFLDHPGAARLGLLGKKRLPFGDLLLRKRNRNEIRLGKIAIVVCILLRAHGSRLHRVTVPAARFLHDRDRMGHALPLAARLMFERGMDALEGVHVFDFDLGAELRLADGTDGDVDVGTHVALFEVAVGNAGVHENLLERRQIGDRLVGGRDVGLGDDLHERSAAAVEVHARMGGVVVDLRGILLEMDVVDADELLRSVRADDLHASADAKRISVFGDLVVLRHVGVEVVLAVECGVTVDLASEHETAHDGKLHGFLVHDRERARIPEAHRAYVSVRLTARFQETSAEHLRVRLQLDVSFKTYRIFEFHFQYPISGKSSFAFRERHREPELLVLGPVGPCRIGGLFLYRAQIERCNARRSALAVTRLLAEALRVFAPENGILRKPDILVELVCIGESHRHEHENLLLHLLARLAAEKLVADPRDVAQVRDAAVHLHLLRLGEAANYSSRTVAH